ncbi:MAG: glycosyltransferase [Firmicutes bacterium]|nr:glycosyltransferase [Bacillota bacterium]
MVLTIVLLSYNTREATRVALDQLIQCTDIPFRLIVLDNGSTDGSVEELKSWTSGHPDHIRLIVSPDNLGFAQGVQRALEERVPDSFIALVNSDVVVGPHWASRLMAHFTDTDNVGAVGPVGRAIGGRQDYARFHGPAEYRDDTWPPGDDYRRFVESLYWSRRGCFCTVKSLSGSCLVISPDAYRLVGGLDPRMNFGAEDLDWSLRARIAGYDLIMADDTYVWHQGSASWDPETPGRANEAWAWFNAKWANQFPQDWDLLTFSQEETTHPPFILRQRCSQPLPEIQPLKLNLGSGSFALSNYVNCDIRDVPGVDCLTDVRHLPFPNSCAREVLASHLLEHLPPEDTEGTLREWVRVLAPGGKIVIIVPDLEYCARRYLDKTWSATLFSRIIFGDQGFEENLHRTAFDEEILTYFLRHVGLTQVTRHNLSPEWQLMLTAVKPD